MVEDRAGADDAASTLERVDPGPQRLAIGTETEGAVGDHQSVARSEQPEAVDGSAIERGDGHRPPPLAVRGAERHDVAGCEVAARASAHGACGMRVAGY